MIKCTSGLAAKTSTAGPATSPLPSSSTLRLPAVALEDDPVSEDLCSSIRDCSHSCGAQSAPARTIVALSNVSLITESFGEPVASCFMYGMRHFEKCSDASLAASSACDLAESGPSLPSSVGKMSMVLTIIPAGPSKYGLSIVVCRSTNSRLPCP